MGASSTRSLFIQIGGGSSDLTVAAKAGKSALLELGNSADDVQGTVRNAFEKLGGSVADQAKAMEQAYARTFANIRSTAQTALKAPTPSGSGVVLNLKAARDESDQANASATFLRTLSDAQARLVETGAEASAGARSLAVSLELQAIAAEKNALASRESVTGLERLAAESGIAVDGLDEVAGAHGRMGASGMIAEHVVRSFSDSLTAGQSPVRAFALEVPRIAEALQFLAAETNATEGFLAKFAGFMGGPWGLAITLGTSILAPFIANLVESGHAADDAKKAEEEYAKSQGDLSDAIDKANGKLVERNRLLSTISLQEKRPDIEAAQSQVKSFSDQAFSAARTAAAGGKAGVLASTLTDAGGLGPVTHNPAIDAAVASAGGDVVKLRNNLDALARQATGPDKAALEQLADSVNRFAGMATAASQKAAQLRGEASAVGTALSGKSILTPDSVQRSVEDKNANTPLEKARQQLRDLDAQKSDLEKMPYSPAQQAALKKWGEELDAATAAVKRLEAAQKDSRDGRQVGRQINLGQAEDIVHGIGGTVTSSYRSSAQQQVLYNRYLAGTGSLAAKPGTSLHESGQALDVAKTAGVSLASLKKAFEDAGVHLTEALDEGNHYHVGFGPKGPSTDTLARRQQAQTTHAANDDHAFQSQLASAQAGYFAAQISLSGNDAQKGSLDRAGLYTGVTQKRAELADQVTAKKLTQAQSDQLDEVYFNTEELAEIGSLQKERLDAIDKQLATEQLQSQGAIALLDLQQALATTTKARRDLALRLLAADEAQRRAPLQAVVDHPELHTPDEVARARTGLDQIDAEHPLKVQQLDRQNASPGQAFANQLNGTSISDSLQQADVGGLNKLEDGLEGVLSGTKSVSAAFHDMASSIVADLLKIGIQQAIIKPLANSLFGGSSGGSGGGLGGLFGGIGKLFGGATTSDKNWNFGSGLPSDDGFADGGHISGPGNGTSDSILARVSNGEFVVNAKATKSNLPLLHAINDNKLPGFAEGGLIGGLPTPAHLSSSDMRSLSRQAPAQVTIGVQSGQMFEPYVASISGAQVQQAAPRIATGGAQLAAHADAARRRRTLS